MADAMRRGPVQLVLDLPLEAAMGREDFIESPSNAAALALVDRWPDWPSRAVLLVGPEGSGKSHLVRIWSERSGAAVAQAVNLTVDAAPRLLGSGALALEDVGRGGLEEAALFHLFNLAREQDAWLLLTTERPPAAWPIRLPDLASRLSAAGRAVLDPPDETLLRRVLVKLLADRQLAADPAVLDYLVPRMERSLGATRQIAMRLDRLTLERRRPVTRALAAEVLAALAEEARLGEAGMPRAPAAGSAAAADDEAASSAR